MENTKDKKSLRVACAIIEDGGKILAAQRGESMSFSFKWEFPGGKVEEGEKPEDAIVREINEELDIDINVVQSLSSNVHDYGKMKIELIPFICSMNGKDIKLNEHSQIIWDFPGNLRELDWADADIPVLKEYIKYLENNIE